MPDARLTAVITALLLIGGGHRADAAFNLAQLQIIEGYVLTKNCGGLLGYLNQNPAIMDGDDPLALELRSFASGVQGGIIECLSVDVTLVDGSQITANSQDIY
ncbi:MAG: hypothetical protein KUG69_10590 [Marinosulfonomonas sp.]|nr:hypothetical protein [Marinosulfonomonas sp.]